MPQSASGKEQQTTVKDAPHAFDAVAAEEDALKIVAETALTNVAGFEHGRPSLNEVRMDRIR